MRLLGKKAKSKKSIDNSASRREPVIGSRKVSWGDRDGDGTRQHPVSTVATYEQPTNRSFSTEMTSRAPHSNFGRDSSGAYSAASGRRQSHQTDTTSRIETADARLIRIRKSDVFRSRPNLKYRDGEDYSRVDGVLPTLHAAIHESPFIDTLADQLDTHQLRTVLDTDSRRRKRRQSTLEAPRDRARLMGPNGSHTRFNSLPVIPRAVSSSRVQTRLLLPSNDGQGFPQDVETTATTPVYDKFMQLKRQNEQQCGSSNAISGVSAHWHDADAMLGISRQPSESGVILAGNRESFPDFAVVDRTNSMRHSTGSGVLSTAWSSLWRRAGTARSKKENDVAEHRSRTLGKMGTEAQRSANGPINPILVPGEFVRPSSSLKRNLSSTSAVLAEDTGDPYGNNIVHIVDEHTSNSPGLIHSKVVDDRIPSDAFYDPMATPRAASRQTHSRNFSRPMNDLHSGQYSGMMTTPNGKTHLHVDPASKAFSPLLSGDSFPIPEQREAVPIDRPSYKPGSNNSFQSTDSAEIIMNEEIGNQVIYSSPSLAAAPPQEARASSTIPFSASTSTHGAEVTYLPSKPMIYNSGVHKQSRSLPAHPITVDEGGLADTPAESVGCDLAPAIQSPPHSDATLHQWQTIPNVDSAMSSYRPTIDNDKSDSDQEESSVDDSGTDTISATEEDLDDVDYEQGVLRTVVGRPVQVVNSQQSPVFMDWNGVDVEHHSTFDDAISESGSVDTLEMPRLFERSSFLSSVQTFHTAENYGSTLSAASSRSTLRSA